MTAYTHIPSALCRFAQLCAVILAVVALALGSAPVYAQHGRNTAKPKAAAAKKGAAPKKGKAAEAPKGSSKKKDVAKKNAKGKGSDKRADKGTKSKGKGSDKRADKSSKSKSRSSDRRADNRKQKTRDAAASNRSRRSEAQRRAEQPRRIEETRRAEQPVRQTAPERTPRRTPAERPVAQRPGGASVPGVDNGPADLAQQTFNGRGANTPVRSKRATPAMPSLTADQVAAVNDAGPRLESMALREYPGGDEVNASAKPLHAEGSIGIYTTARLRAGYFGNPWPYDYSAHLDLSGSNGFVENGARSSIGIGVRGGYIIGNQYGIFSGGHMGAGADYQRDRYRRYAVAGSPERASDAWRADISGRNSNSGVAFELRGAYRQLALADSATTDETSLDGAGKIRAEWGGLALGGEADLRITNLAGTSISFLRLEGYTRYKLPLISLRGGVALGVGKNIDGTSATRLAPLAELNLYPIRGLTLAAGMQGGVSQTTLADLLKRNPYVELAPMIHHQQEKIGFKGALRFERWEWFGARISVAHSSFDDFAYFAGARSGLFAPRYAAATSTTMAGDFFLELTSRDMVALQASVANTTLDSTGAQAPYVPKVEGEAMYVKRLEGIPLTVTGSLKYVGARNDDMNVELKGAVLLGLKGRYDFTRTVYATLTAENLADQRYELWRGYGERGVFIAIGAGISY